MRFLSLQLSPRWKFLVAVLLLTGIATYSLIRSEKIREQVEDVWEGNNAKLVYLVDMRLTLKSSARSLEKILTLTPGAALTEEQKRLHEKLGQYQQLEQGVVKVIEKSVTTSRNEKALVHKIGVDRMAALGLIRRIEEMSAGGHAAAAMEVYNKELRTGPLAAWQSGVDELITTENEANADAGVVASNEYEQLRSSVLMMCALIVVLGLLALWQTIKRNAGEQM